MRVQKVERLVLTGNHAISYAVKQADVDVVAAYPISPQTPLVEGLSEYVASGELKASYILVESEHSAISAVLSAATAGARAFTATCSQGLLLMHEILFITSALRAPVVMAIANRTVSGPINIWNDHSDVMPQRDAGWVQFFVESVQEAYDRVIQAYRIAEDGRVRLPVMVNFDGVVLSHTSEPILPLSDEEVAYFTPWKSYSPRLDPDEPVTMGALAYPDYYYETKHQTVKALEGSLSVVDEVDREFHELSGRRHGITLPYGCEDADLILLSMGSVSSTIRATVRRLRAMGERVGMVSLKLFRPFPTKELIEHVKGAKAVGIVDRALSPGGVAGPLFTDVATALYLSKLDLPIIDFIVGIGGRDVKPSDVKGIFRQLDAVAKKGAVEEHLRYVGLRE